MISQTGLEELSMKDGYGKNYEAYALSQGWAECHLCGRWGVLGEEVWCIECLGDWEQG